MSSTNENNIQSRLSYLRNKRGDTQARFAEKIGISLRAYRNYERGDREVSKELICALLNTFRVDPVWLLTGEGSIYRTQTTVSSGVLDMSLLKEVIADLESELSRQGKVLNPDDKAMAISLLYDMEQHEYTRQERAEKLLYLVG